VIHGPANARTRARHVHILQFQYWHQRRPRHPHTEFRRRRLQAGQEAQEDLRQLPQHVRVSLLTRARVKNSYAVYAANHHRENLTQYILILTRTRPAPTNSTPNQQPTATTYNNFFTRQAKRQHATDKKGIDVCYQQTAEISAHLVPAENSHNHQHQLISEDQIDSSPALSPSSESNNNKKRCYR